MSYDKLGNIQLILGCMFSGKTSELIRRIQRYKSIQKKVLFVNYMEDTRYNNKINENNIYTHDKVGCEGIYLSKLSSLIDKIGEYDVFVINEGQFFEDIFM